MKDSSVWLVTSPADSDPLERLEDLRQALGNGKLAQATLVELPEFKVRRASLSLSRRVIISSHEGGGALTPRRGTDGYTLVPLDPVRVPREAGSDRDGRTRKDGRIDPFPHDHLGRSLENFAPRVPPRARRRETVPRLCLPPRR